MGKGWWGTEQKEDEDGYDDDDDVISDPDDDDDDDEHIGVIGPRPSIRTQTPPGLADGKASGRGRTTPHMGGLITLHQWYTVPVYHTRPHCTKPMHCNAR